MSRDTRVFVCLGQINALLGTNLNPRVRDSRKTNLLGHNISITTPTYASRYPPQAYTHVRVLHTPSQVLYEYVHHAPDETYSGSPRSSSYRSPLAHFPRNPRCTSSGGSCRDSHSAASSNQSSWKAS